MLAGEQHASDSKGFSFYKVLFLLAKGANDISFFLSHLRGGMTGIPHGLAGVGSK